MLASVKILIKRQLKSVVFVMLLVVLPVLYILLSDITFEEDDDVNVLLAVRDKDEITQNIADALIEGFPGYNFHMCDEEEMYEKVRSNKVECGYIFPKNLSKRIDSGKRKGNIILVERMGSLKTDEVNEIVFSEYYKQYVRQYISSTYGDEEAGVEFKRRYDNYFLNQVDDIIEIDKVEVESDMKRGEVFSIRNIYAILMFVIVLISVVQFVSDRKKGFLSSMDSNRLRPFRILYPLVSTGMLGCSILVGIILKGGFENALMECIIMGMYVVVLSVFGALISYIVKSYQVILGAIPVLFMVNLVVCPVIIDITSYSPVFGLFRWFLVPYYYMILF